MKIRFYIFLLIVLTILTSCVKEVRNVGIIVEDQYRHYYPIIQGQPLELSWKIANDGDEPLVITDIIPSCGCVELENGKNNIIPPGKYIELKFRFDSSKNSGYSSESIFIYGNINAKNDSNFVELVFDTNVVPVYGTSPDYEEYYMNNSRLEYAVKGVINGQANERGYWVDDSDYEGNYSRTYKKYPWLDDSVDK